MLWLFSGKTRTRTAPGARRMRMDCPECRKPCAFVEVEVESTATVWFVPVLTDTERLWNCTGCGETFELRDEDPALPAPRDLRAELERERATRDAAARQLDRKVDDELAALKKKLGK